MQLGSLPILKRSRSASVLTMVDDILPLLAWFVAQYSSPPNPLLTALPLIFINQGDQNKAGNFSFVLSTASPYTAVAAAGCANCAAQAGQAPVYVPPIIEATFYSFPSRYNLSSSAFRQGINQSIDIGDGNMAGEQIRETCSFKKVSGGSWTYPNQSGESFLSLIRFQPH